MSENIFLIWNGWGVLFTSLLILDAVLSRIFNIKFGSGTPLKGILVWFVTVPSVILTFILSGWILGLAIWPLSVILGALILMLLEKLNFHKE